MPAAMFYVQHLVGIGHLMRAGLVAEALAAAGFDVHLVSGGMPVDARRFDRVNMLQLPPVRVEDADFSTLRDPGGNPVDDAYRQRRREHLLAAYEAIAPAVVVCETFPFGRRALGFELVPLLERIAATRPRPLTVASVRDILQSRNKPGREREMLETANRWFDAVLVHGDPRFARFDQTFPLAAELTPPVHYTGFVCAPGSARSAAARRDRREIVVSAGGGAVGADLLATALAARRESCFGQLPWRLLAGPNLPNDAFQALLRDAPAGAIVEPARADFRALLDQALVSVSQAGYNTMLDVVRAGTRAVLVPYMDDGETEQLSRARRLGQLGLAIVIEGGQLSPASLAEAIDAAGTRDAWGRWEFDCDGAARSAACIKALVEAGRAGART